MITTKIRNKSLIKVLAILSVTAVPLLQNHQTAYADRSSSQVTVTASDLNVREAADISSKIINLVHQGDTFEVIQTMNNWDQIKLLSNQTGWVNNAYITPTENINATVEAFSLSVRENPCLSSHIGGYLKFGTKITIQSEEAGWAKIVSPSGVIGWVNEYYITKDGPSNQQTQPITSTPTSKTTTSHTTDKKSLPPTTKSSSSTDEKSSSPSTKSSDTSGAQMTTQSIETDNLMQDKQEPLKGKTIVLDPGHGGKDDGTTSIVGTHEKSLTLPTAEVVKQKLENAGTKVVLTRTNDTYIPLKQRAYVSNQNHADAFISFHYNWSNDSSVKGITDFFYQKSNNSLASDILNEIVKTTGLNNDGTRFDDLDVLRSNSQPCTLIELGFLSNKQDDSVVESSAYRNNVAQGVYQGLLDYFQSKNK